MFMWKKRHVYVREEPFMSGGRGGDMFMRGS